MDKRYTVKDHTFVICAHAESPFLEDAVRSIESQTQLGHVLVTTSTPNDHIAGICESHGLPLIVNRKESSIALDWNFGYDQAQSRLVTIVHQDDVYEPAFLERVVRALNACRRDVGVVHTGYYELRAAERVDGNGILRVKHVMNKAFNRAMMGNGVAAKRRALSFGDFVCCPSVTFAKEIVGPSVFDVVHLDSCDWRTWLSLANRNIRFLYVPEPLMGHRIHAESATSQIIKRNVRAAEDLEILESLWPRPVAHALASVYSRCEKSNEV